MCIRDRNTLGVQELQAVAFTMEMQDGQMRSDFTILHPEKPVSYTHLRAHETVLDLVCRLLLEKKKKTRTKSALSDNEEITRQSTSTLIKRQRQ
mgnify:CR=1 FL=1